MTCKYLNAHPRHQSTACCTRAVCIYPLEVPDIGDLVEYGHDIWHKAVRWRVTSWHRVEEGRMRFCLREKATHVGLTGVSGAIAPIEDCKIVDRVDWPQDRIDDEVDLAVTLGRNRTVV